MDEELVLVFDCGATNLKASVVNHGGNITAHASRSNSPYPQKDGKPGWLIWDLEEISRKLYEGSREVLKVVDPESIKAVIVTTWGSDGAPIRRDGTLTYPPISYQCPRTQEIAMKIGKRMPPWEIFQISGYQIIPNNTLFKLIWLKENVPEALDDAYIWLMMPGLLVHKLTGEFHIDPTSASTMMAMDVKKRDWSSSLLKLAGLDPSFFPEWYEPGQIIGYITDEAEKRSGIPSRVPVVVGGHDTNFAFFGSGSGLKEAILSSGTWEVIGVRTDFFSPSLTGFEEGLIIEADPQPGIWNPQLFMMGSGALEWVLDKFFYESGDEKYEAMNEEAERVSPGSDGVIFIPSFERGTTKRFGTKGAILGLSLRTSRPQILRAALEGLSFQLKEALQVCISYLADATGDKVDRIRAVGGGSRNALWNQIRADVTGLPVVTTKYKEATTVGAALVAFTGIGHYSSLEDARKYVFSEEEVFKPGSNQGIYETIFKRHKKALESLKNFY